jgi:hypothetical protein
MTFNVFKVNVGGQGFDCGKYLHLDVDFGQQTPAWNLAL